jgi:DNA-binding MarR family transcriptional regulator
MSSALTRQELDMWRGFRFMVEETSLGVSRALLSATGMSGGQFGILTILVETSLHSMRQQQLADAMRWDRTRLSHQLTRMEAHGWIKRKKGDGGITLVLLAEAGRKEQQRAAPMLGQIVKEKFFSRLTQGQLGSLEEIRKALKDPQGA